jgi:hypothetical protein
MTFKSILNKLFGSKTVAKTESQPITIPKKEDPLDSAWRKFQENEFDEVIKIAETFQEGTDERLKYESAKLIGLAKFRQHKFAEAENMFSRLAADSNDPDDWFNLVTSSTMNRNISLSKSSYDRTLELCKARTKKNSVSMPQVMYYYMLALRDIQEYSLAHEQLVKLTDTYSSLGITDPTFLYLRGVPFFSETLEQAKAILENNAKEKSLNLLNTLKANVDEDGKEFLDKFILELKYAVS